MSSPRNAVQRRNHRERAQPTERAKWGLLEKRKDYKLRAADHKSKQRRLKTLQEKARDRNEDEFYFGMMSSRTEGGIKVAKRTAEQGGSGNLSPEVVRLMKTQDVAYLRTILQRTKKERERLEEEVLIGEVGTDAAPAARAGRKVVFGEDGTAVRIPQQEQEEFDDDLMLDDEFDSEDRSDQEDEDVSPEVKLKRRRQAVKRRKLEGLRDRETELSVALREVEDQRAKSNGTMGGTAPDGKRMKARRKR